MPAPFPTIDHDSDPGAWADALCFECPSRQVSDHARRDPVDPLSSKTPQIHEAPNG